MRKNIKRINKFLSLVMVVIITSITTFASVVSDNDGSAFITKSEFDSLKNDFQSQIDQYNTTIDNKIDTSIAAYLAGITIAAQERLTNYFVNAKKNSEDNLGFMLWQSPKNHRSTGTGAYDVEASYAVGNIWGVNQGSNVTGNGVYNYIFLNNHQAYNAGIRFIDYLGTAKNSAGTAWTGNVKDFKSAYYWINLPFKGTSDDWREYKDTTNWTLKDIVRHRLHMKLEASKIGFTSAQSGSYNSESDFSSATKYSGGTLTIDYSNDFTQPAIKDLGTVLTTQIGFQIKPILTQTHQWTQFDKDSDFSSTENDTENNKFLRYNISGTIPSWEIAGTEYEKRDYYKGNAVTATIMEQPPQSSAHTGAKPGVVLGFVWKGQRVSDIKRWDGAYNDITYSFKWKIPKYFSVNYNKLNVEYFAKLFAKAHYKFNGIPLTKVNKEGKLTFYLTFNSSTADNYTYCIMDKKFDNGDMPTSKKETLNGVQYDRVLKTDTIKNTKGDKEIKFEIKKDAIFDKENGDYIYVKIVPTTNDQLVTVDCTKDIMLELKK